MTKTRSTKRALLMSGLALLVCVSMLIGSTFAWFTDSVTSGNNKIVSGNLDVVLEYKSDWANDWTPVDENTKVFKEGALYEPGYTEVVFLRVSNAGSLALKYNLMVNIASEKTSTNVNGDEFKLSDYLQIGTYCQDEYSSGANYADLLMPAMFGTREAALAEVSKNVPGVTPLTKLSEADSVVKSDDPILAGEQTAKVMAIVLTMPETVGNEANYDIAYEAPEVNLCISLVATQYTEESDSFDNLYDADASYPIVNTAYIPAGTTAATQLECGEVTVSVPAGADAGTYALKVENKSVTTNDEGTTVSYDVTLYKDGVEVSGVTYPVEIEIGSLLNVFALTRNGVATTSYTYDAMEGVVSFETDSITPFAVSYTDIPTSDVVINDENKIVAGVFEGVNPAELDNSLVEEDSEYIAVNYVKDGKTYYTVSERATTLIVAANDTNYTAINGNYTVQENANGSLYKAFNGLFKTGVSTVYILPGTYNEGTTLTVSSNMDIMGLGDAKDIKITWLGAHSTTTTKPSNRHLFNVNGAVTLSEHIQVTISNLYLDATANNTYKNKFGMTLTDDNAAVQSIRMSKVKCYDLIINDGNYPFYVNGKYDARGAYMYVENCKLIGKIATDQTPFASPCALHYYNLTYSNGTSELTTNNTYYTNVKMEPDDWNW